MKPVDFIGSNCTYAKNQKEYLPLPAFKDFDGVVTSCWKPSILERICVMFYGRVWVQQRTFDNPLQPQRVSATKPTQPKDSR